MATEAVEDQEERFEAEATNFEASGSNVTSEKLTSELPEVKVFGVADSSSSSSMSGSWFKGGLGSDICLGGNGGGFRNPDVATFEVDIDVFDDVAVVIVVELDSDEATHVLGTSEGHLQKICI